MSAKKFQAKEEEPRGFDEIFDEIIETLNAEKNPTDDGVNETAMRRLFHELEVEREARMKAEKKARKERKRRKELERLCRQYEEKLYDGDDAPRVHVNVDIDNDNSQWDIRQTSQRPRPEQSCSTNNGTGKGSSGVSIEGLDLSSLNNIVQNLFKHSGL